MFREIRTSERITEQDERERRERENFRKIKPETNITVKEAIDFVNQMFMSMAMENSEG